MEWIYAFTPPIPPHEVEKIAELLRDRDVFVTGFDPVHRDPYSVSTYIEKQEIYDEPVSLFVDRNVVSRLVSMMDGAEAAPEHRVAAAIMAFAQVCQLLIEPSIAVHEYASTAGERKARRELRRFYQADNVDTKMWTDIALGRTSKCPRIARSSRSIAHRLDRTLYRWQRNYAAVLKIADLELRGGPGHRRMEAFMDWMFHDFLLAGAATILAAQYFAPGAPKKGLLKHLRSPDREQAIDGIKNAAWDLMLLSDWLQRVQERERIDSWRPHPVLCTLDKGVVRLARSIVLFEHVARSQEELIASTFEHLWGSEAGSRLAKRYVGYVQKAQDPDRHFNRNPGTSFVPEMIEAGEANVRGHVF